MLLEVMTKLVANTQNLIFVSAEPEGSSRQFAEDRVCGSHRGCGVPFDLPTSQQTVSHHRKELARRRVHTCTKRTIPPWST